VLAVRTRGQIRNHKQQQSAHIRKSKGRQVSMTGREEKRARGEITRTLKRLRLRPQ
jgi:hypothetical protein